MINAGEVGAVFRIVDEGSPVLRRLMEQFNALQGAIERTQAAMKALAMPPGLNRSLGTMEGRFRAVADASKVTGDVASASFAKIDSAMAATAANLGNVSREMKAIAAEARAINGPASLRTGGGSRGGGSGGGVHFGGAAVPLPGDQHVRISGTPAIAAAGAIAYGAFEEGKIEDFANRIFMTGGLPVGNLTANPLFGKIRDAILKAYVTTGLPLDQIEEGILTGTRGLAGIDLEKRLALMPGLLAASATEAYLKDGTTIPEAMQAFVGLAHMEGKYAPDEIAKLADHFAYLSTTTPVSVKQIEGAASYAIPMLRTANFDPEQVLLMITAMERAGITNTKAGTWISQLATQSFPGTSLMSKMLFKRHESALRDLGLIDGNDNPTWFTDGRPDLVKMTGIAGNAIEKMDAAHRLAIEKALWGQQGGRAAGFFADPTNRAIMGRVADDEKNFISGEAMWNQTLENSPIVQFRTAFAGLNVELMNLGSNVLPFVTSALKQANNTLGGKGELAVIGGPIAAWFNRGLVWSGAKSLGSRLLGYGAGAASLPGLIDAITDDNRTPEARAIDKRISDSIKGWLGYDGQQHGWSPAWLAFGDRARADLSLLKSGYTPAIFDSEQRREASRGRAMSGAPAPNVETKVDVKVMLDGRSIAAAVEKYIVTNNRTVNSSSGHDGMAAPTYPDFIGP